MNDDDKLIIYHEIVFSIDKGRMKKFISLDKNEVVLKTSEVLLESDCVHLKYSRYSTTKKYFLGELRKIMAGDL